MSVLAAVGMALALAAIPAFAGDFDDGYKFYESRDYARAIKSLRKAAEQGHAAAQYNLGLMYRKGQGVAKDYRQAAFWYEKAAARENGFAQFDLAAMYAEGQGVAQDYKQAASWFEKAAAQGYASAQFNLGVMYT